MQERVLFFDLWPKDEAVQDIISVIFSILHKYYKWPNTYFIPENPFDIVSWDFTGGLISVEADAVLTSKLEIPEDISFIDMALNRSWLPSRSDASHSGSASRDDSI